MRLHALALAGLIALSGLSAARAAEGETLHLVAGGPSTAKLVTDRKAELEKVAGAPIDIKASSSEACMLALAKDLVDGAFTGFDPKQSMSVLAAKGVADPKASDYQWLEVLRVEVFIGVNPENPVTSLSREQVADVLSGKIKTWEPINGRKTPIKVLMASNYQAISKAVLQYYRDGKPSPMVQHVIDKAGLVRGLQTEPGALGFFSTAETVGGFTPKYLPTGVTHSSYFYMKKKARPAAQKLFDHLAADAKSHSD